MPGQRPLYAVREAPIKLSWPHLVLNACQDGLGALIYTRIVLDNVQVQMGICLFLLGLPLRQRRPRKDNKKQHLCVDIKDSHEYFPKHNHPNFQQKQHLPIHVHKGQGAAIFHPNSFRLSRNASFQDKLRCEIYPSC